MKIWIKEGLARQKDDQLTTVFRENYKGELVLVARGYEFNRIQTFEKDGEKKYMGGTCIDCPFPNPCQEPVSRT